MKRRSPKPRAPDSEPPTVSRRRFLQAAGAGAAALVLGVHVPLASRARAAAGSAGPLTFDPNVFLRIAADDTVTIVCKHFEMGQGITTGLATLAAEELEADWSQMRFTFAPYNPDLYGNLAFGPYMVTGGSNSIAGSWVQMRKVGAAARTMLVQAAAARWGVPPEEIAVAKGVVSHAPSRRSARFGELAEDAMRLAPPKDVALKEPKDWKLIGRKLPRLDAVAKTTGKATFAMDVRRPGELIAMVRRPDVFGAKVVSFDDSYAMTVPGVVGAVKIPTGVAVIATNTWAAMGGRDLVQVTWDTSAAELRSTHEIVDDYRQRADEPGREAARRGDAAAALTRASHVLEAEFVFPYLAHAPMEPMSGSIALSPNGAEIWAGCQIPSLDAHFAAKALGFEPNQIKINTQLGGGSFGRRGSTQGDWITELAEIAKAIGGTAPIRMVWTREDDIKGGFYRPLTLHRVKAGLDAVGRLSGWQHSLVTQSLFIGTPLEEVMTKDRVDRGSVEGLIDTPYDLPDFLVEVHYGQSAVPVLWWRSVGHSHTAHVVETMLDELARRAGRDPLAFRRGLLASEPRLLGVLELAARKAGWGRPMAKGRGRGIACHTTFGTPVAMVAEVTVARGAFKVDRIVCAVDCGVAVNPDVIEAQVEGSVGFALSSVLRNKITLRKGVVEQSNFDDYNPTRFSEMPKVEVHIVKSLQAPTGIGEPAVPPLAPAIGNALAAATGKRLYSLPFDAALLG